MAMRRSRIKLAPNLGAKARAPSRPSTPAAADIKVKQESAEKDLLNNTVVKLENAKVTPAKAEENPTKETPNTDIPPEREATGKETDNAQGKTGEVPVVASSGPKVLTTGDIIPLELLQAANKITEVVTKEEDSEGRREDGEQDKKDSLKTPPGHRVRNWFPKAKPNLAEAGRARMRHNSFSGDEDVRSPPVVARVPSRVRQPSVSESPSSDPPPPVKEEGAKEKPAPPAQKEVVEEERPKPNINNSLGIDLGSATRKPKVEKDEENKRKVRKVERLDEPVDRSKVTMGDLIYMNPINNPMSKRDKGKKRKSGDERSVKSESEDERKSVVGDVSQDVLEVPKDDPDMALVPQVKIGVNGEIIINESSLLLENRDPEADAKAASMELIHESDLPALPFAYGHKSPNRLWSEMETKKFYLALSAVGTDFSLMGKLFPKRNRAELKRKFKREEKCNRYLIDKAIRERQHFDQEFFDNLAALEIEEPKPKRQRKRKEPTTTDEEDQENQADKAGKENKKGPKSKEDKGSGEEGKPAKKPRRKRKPKVDENKEAEVGEEAGEEKAKPKRATKRRRTKKSLTYAESDTEDDQAGQKETDMTETNCNDGVAKKKGKKKAKTPPPASTSTDTASAVPPEGDEQEADVSGEETLEVNPEKNSSKTKRAKKTVTKKGKGIGKKKPSTNEEGEATINEESPESTTPMPQKRKRGRPSQGTPTVDVQENNAEPAQQTPTQETVPAKKPRRKTKSVKETEEPDPGQPSTPDVHSTNPLQLETGKEEEQFSLSTASVSVMSSPGLIETEGPTSTLRHGSYVFVASTPPGDLDSEPVIHVYLVSPNKDENEEDEVGNPPLHPTPSPMGSPVKERSGESLAFPKPDRNEIPLEESGDSHTDGVGRKGESGGVGKDPGGGDLSESEFVYTERVDIVDGYEAMANEVEERTVDISLEPAPPPGDTNPVVKDSPLDQSQINSDKDHSESSDTLGTSIEGSSPSVIPVKNTLTSSKDNQKSPKPNSPKRMKSPQRPIASPSIVKIEDSKPTPSERINSDPSKVTEPQASISVNKQIAQQKTVTPVIPPHDTNNDTKPAQIKTGRRRRIAAMPNIPAGRKPRSTPGSSTPRPPGSVVVRAGATPRQPQVAPPAPSSSVNEVGPPPIDDATAGDILLEMSMSMSGAED